MVLRRIPIYFLPTIVHDLKPELASRAYAFGREMVCSQKSVRNRNFFENVGCVYVCHVCFVLFILLTGPQNTKY